MQSLPFSGGYYADSLGIIIVLFRFYVLPPLPLCLPVGIALSLVTAFLVIAHSASLKIKEIKRTHHVKEQFIISIVCRKDYAELTLRRVALRMVQCCLDNKIRNF
jgi:hypothetical protein